MEQSNPPALVRLSEVLGPIAWMRRHPDGTWTDELMPNWCIEQVRKDSGAWVPLYDQAMLEATAEDAARVARDAEAHYWRSMVERLTVQADEWSRRYMALVQQVADGRAMQPAPPIRFDLGPNVLA